MQKRAAIYVRVSTDKQTVENQVAALRHAIASTVTGCILRAVDPSNNKQTTSKADPPPDSVLKVVSPLPMPFDRTVTWRQFAH